MWNYTQAENIQFHLIQISQTIQEVSHRLLLNPYVWIVFKSHLQNTLLNVISQWENHTPPFPAYIKLY